MNPMLRMLALAGLLLSATSASALNDDLQCIKIKEKAAKAVYTADLAPIDPTFDVAPGCVIKLPAKWLCLDVIPDNFSPAEPAPAARDTPQTFLCYRTSCPAQQVTKTYNDSFGAHEITTIKTGMVCRPVFHATSTSCADGVQNGNESDTDCGGSCPVACANGDTCAAAADCESGICSGGICTANPGHCSNSLKDLDETDVDCGGPCPGCAPGKLCGKPTDCSSGECHLGVCSDPAHCTNSVKDVDEGDIDCGGQTCSKCEVGDTCSFDLDCASYTCSRGLCVEPSCTDGHPNQDETGIDCGGSVCPKCQLQEPCVSATDCASNFCSMNDRCELARCYNGATDGDESDVDCGGNDCQRCVIGATCNAPSDCSSFVCNGGSCAAPACYDPVQMCGGECGPCGPGGQCQAPHECMTGVCHDGFCF